MVRLQLYCPVRSQSAQSWLTVIFSWRLFTILWAEEKSISRKGLVGASSRRYQKACSLQGELGKIKEKEKGKWREQNCLNRRDLTVNDQFISSASYVHTNTVLECQFTSLGQDVEQSPGEVWPSPVPCEDAYSKPMKSQYHKYCGPEYGHRCLCSFGSSVLILRVNGKYTQQCEFLANKIGNRCVWTPCSMCCRKLPKDLGTFCKVPIPPSHCCCGWHGKISQVLTSSMCSSWL